MVGILVGHPSITGATGFMPPKLVRSALRALSNLIPHYGNMPQLSSADVAIRAAIDLCWALRNPSPASPLAALGDAKMDTIKRLSDIFSIVASPEPPPPAQLPRVRIAPLPPPRVGATSTPPAPDRGPHLIAAEPDELVRPDLRSSPLRRSPRFRTSAPHVLYPDPSGNAVIDANTGQALNYRLLLAGADRTLWPTISVILSKASALTALPPNALLTLQARGHHPTHQSRNPSCPQRCWGRPS
jgi:hypothetical protein